MYVQSADPRSPQDCCIFLKTYSASGINRYSGIIIVMLKVILGMTLWILYNPGFVVASTYTECVECPRQKFIRHKTSWLTSAEGSME